MPVICINAARFTAPQGAAVALALVEGVRLVEEALAAGLKLRGALICPTSAHGPRYHVAGGLSSGASPSRGLGAGARELADTETPQGYRGGGGAKIGPPTSCPCGRWRGAGDRRSGSGNVGR
jgi:hypothetical protein